MSSPRIAVGVDIGGTKVLGALVDETGAVLSEHRVASPGPWPEMRDAIVGVINELRVQVPEVDSVGVGAAGMVDLDGMIHYAPNVPGFRTVPVRASLAEATGLPTIVDNDANTAAYAEIKVGVAKGVLDALVITLGTGIGGGVIVNGRVLRGANGFAAEIGHFQIDPAGPMCACGEIGHWEAMASGNALGQMARDARRGGSCAQRPRAGRRTDRCDRRAPRQCRRAHGRAGRARAGGPVQLQRRDRPRRAREHLRPGADRDRGWARERR